jgi:hypothetical protein
MQYRYNVTMRRVCESLLPWKRNKYLHICLCVCVCVCVCVSGSLGLCKRVRACSLANTKCKGLEPYCDVTCGPSVFYKFFDIIS